jgi:hypothetical protein
MSPLIFGVARCGHASATPTTVIRGLDPRIHPSAIIFDAMDGRVNGRP